MQLPQSLSGCLCFYDNRSNQSINKLQLAHKIFYVVVICALIEIDKFRNNVLREFSTLILFNTALLSDEHILIMRLILQMGQFVISSTRT